MLQTQARRFWYTGIWLTALMPLLVGCPALAQLVPDNTLGKESSRVTPNVQIRGGAADRIDGGAQRGQNLFHSFQEFNIGNGQRVYFADPVDVRNILTRVTGTNLSNIQGTLGVDGNANLFLMNPNGIVFGPNTRLDVNGSFVGTTANAIGFGTQGFFSTTDQQAPPLLTVQPSALLFSSQLATPSRILVQGDGQGIRTSPTLIDTQTGLRVPGDQTLALIGGNLIFNGATLKTAGGRIELGSVASGSVELVPVADGWTFNYANVPAFQDVQFAQQSAVDASGLGGGNIQVRGRQITLTNGSEIEASTLGSQPGGRLNLTASDSVNLRSSATDNFYTGLVAQVYSRATGKGGDITVTADRLNLAGNYAIATTSTYGSGQGGNLTIHANNSVEVTGSAQENSLTRVEADASGNAGGQGGNLTIDTRQLQVRNAQVSASTTGTGQAGNLTVRAADSVELSGEILGGRNGFPGGLFAVVNDGATGQGGNLTINTRHLRVSDGSKAQAISFGRGNSGDVNIVADDIDIFETAQPNRYTTGIFVGAGLDPNNTELSQGGRGNLIIHANRVSVHGGEISATTQGQGDAGRILIQARDSVEVVDTSAETGYDSSITANVNSRATGQGGDLTIETRNLTVSGSRISASTSGTGNAGDLTIRASDSIDLSGESLNRSFPGGVLAQVDRGATGQGGNLRIETRHLSISDGSKVQAITFGNGDAGNVSITADNIKVFETAQSNFFTTGIFVGSGLDYRNTELPQGGRGNLTIRANQISIHGGEISANTQGRGDAGKVLIQARDSVEVVDATAETGDTSFIGATVEPGATGQGGNVTIETNRLRVLGGQIAASTSGQGNAGTLRIIALDSILLTGESPAINGSPVQPGGLFARVRPTASGRGGSIRIRTGRLDILNGSQIQVTTLGKGDAGNLFIRANEINVLDTSNSNISATGIFAGDQVDSSSRVLPTGNGGDLTVRTHQLNLQNGEISTSIAQGATGNSGNINIYTNSLSLRNRSRISAATDGNGRAGDITIHADRLSSSDSNISTEVQFNAIVSPNNRNNSHNNRNQQSDIDITTQSLRLDNNAHITASTNGQGRAGNVTITSNTLEATRGGRVSTSTSTSSRAGSLTLRDFDQITLDGRNSGLFARTAANSRGRGGDIEITTNRLNVQNGAAIAVNSRGKGQAGNLRVNADTIQLDRGILNAETRTSNGGNITLQDLDLLLLRRNSSISSTAGTAQAGGNGGNINISDGFIVAVPSEDSDIRANAFSGRGGAVNIGSQGLLGIASATRSIDGQSDITASSAQGVQGTVTLNTPNVDPSRGLVELPTVPVDASTQIAATCPTNTEEADRLGSFIVSGRGGLPPNPTDLLSDDNLLTEWVMPQTDAKAVVQQSAAPDQPIVEAQGWVKNTNGEIQLVAGASAAPSSPHCVY